MSESITARSQTGGAARLKIVARYFWPYSGPRELGIGELANGLVSLGHDVEIVTIGWDRKWPVQFQFHGARVTRLPRPTTGPWGSCRYLKSLTRHLTTEQPDRVIVCGLGEESIAIRRSLSPQIPIVYRLDELTLGNRTSAEWLQSRQIQALAAADLVLVESEWTAERLHGISGLSGVPIRVAVDGIETSVARDVSPSRQQVARRMFADAHPMLSVAEGQALVIAAAPMNGDRGWIDLVDAWRRIARRLPNARLWLVGEGSKSRLIWDAIVDRQLTEHVIMPGQIDDLDDLFQAADLFVHPLRGRTYCSMLLRAMGAGLAPLVTADHAMQLGLEHDRDAIVVPTGDPQAMAALIQAALANRPHRDILGAESRQRVATHFRIQDRLIAYLEPASVP